MMAAGISKIRTVKPLLAAAAAVSLLAVANRELVIPRYRAALTRDTRNLSGDQQRDMEAKYDARQILFGGEKVVLADRRIVNPAFILPSELSSYGIQLNAAVARYFDAKPPRAAGFLMSGVTAPTELLDQPSLTLGGDTVIITPRDADWLGQDELFVATDLPFELLASGSAWRNYASTGELIAELNRPSTVLSDDVRVAVHSRIVQPLMDGTLLMLGLPLMFSRRSRNIFLSIGVCVVVATAFSLTALGCASVGNLGLMAPSLAAWLPLMLFVPLATWIGQSLRT